MASLTNEKQIHAFRATTLLRALSLELKGLSRRGRSAYAIIKDEYGFKGNKQKVYDQLKANLTERGIL
jgi:hypothetical protein